MRSERRKLHKMKNQQLVPPSRQCSSTPVRFGQGFRSKKNNVTTLQHPTYSPVSSWYLRVPSTECSIYDVTDIIRNVKKEVKCISQNGFQERFQHLYSQKCTDARRVSFWRKSSFSDCTVMYFSEIKCFQERPAATMDEYKLTAATKEPDTMGKRGNWNLTRKCYIALSGEPGLEEAMELS